jgi:hypothetical protein
MHKAIANAIRHRIPKPPTDVDIVQRVFDAGEECQGCEFHCNRWGEPTCRILDGIVRDAQFCPGFDAWVCNQEE